MFLAANFFEYRFRHFWLSKLWRFETVIARYKKEEAYSTKHSPMPSFLSHLQNKMLSRSHSSNWADARHEWHLCYVFYGLHYGDYQCLCGHRIKEACVLRNIKNGGRVIVGNVCVKKFMDLDAPYKICQAFKRVLKDNTLRLSKVAVEYARTQDWINDWERQFYLKTWSRCKLWERQARKRLEINNRVIQGIRSARQPTDLKNGLKDGS